MTLLLKDVSRVEELMALVKFVPVVLHHCLSSMGVELCKTFFPFASDPCHCFARFAEEIMQILKMMICEPA